VQQLADFHHYSTFRPGPRTPVERLEERVIAMLLETKVGDDRRESSVCFELKHSSAVTQFARLLARRRGLPPELCAVGGLLHDIHVIVDGGYAEHAAKGAPIARAMVEEVGGFSESEIRDIESIVRHHSDKHLMSDDPFAEFGKDIDVLDCFLYPGAVEWYLANKPLVIFQHYLSRAARVWGELGVPPDPCFDLLADYDQPWLDTSMPADLTAAASDPAGEDPPCPPFLLLRERQGWSIHFRAEAWAQVADSDSERVRRLNSAAMQAFSAVNPGATPEAVIAWPAIGRVEPLDSATLASGRADELLGRPVSDVQGAVG
jgi:putative nucleotidyltransferase with HDIG domain